MYLPWEQELDGQVDHWMAAYEQDLDMKTRDVQELKVHQLK